MKFMPNAIGLAANQVGIQKRVCVLWFDRKQEPYIYVNPRIVPVGTRRFAFLEGCLSFEGDNCRTLRYVKVMVDHLGPKGHIYDTVEVNDPSSTLFSACLQHEVDHLDGITMFDRSYIL
jgi:peptide deformylase